MASAYKRTISEKNRKLIKSKDNETLVGDLKSAGELLSGLSKLALNDTPRETILEFVELSELYYLMTIEVASRHKESTLDTQSE
ncbi:hypothetical protein [Streptomyces sp. CoH17]|uniref:hypothetical protein n=1 Tax=Streptomyces sp. CoH17 TaxID=2992806 RepID=UPI00226D5B87|nr:hypothetical protein [Streptomyces sp. CoH17]